MISDKKLNLYVLLGLILFSVVIRFPWFYLDTINWDESVYIIVGQSLADGHLPYTQIWENKPPLAFAFYALCEYLVPGSLAFIRFSGAVLIGATSWLVFLTARLINPFLNSLFAGVLSTISASILLPFAQCVMLEHIAIAPIMLGVYLICKKNIFLGSNIFLVGLLFGVASLIRTNLIILPATITLYFAITYKAGWKLKIKLIFTFLAGISFSLFLVYLPYLLANQTDSLYVTLIQVPLAYVSGVNDPYSKIFLDLLKNITLQHEELGVLRPIVYLLRITFWASGLFGLIILLIQLIKNGDHKLQVLFMINIALIGSIIASKHSFEHYLLQITPIFCINIGYLIKVFKVNKALIRLLSIFFISSSFIISSALPEKSYYEILKSYINHRSPYYGYSFHISEFINSKHNSGDSLFVTHYALTYWLTKTMPVVPTVILPFGMLDDDAMVRAYYGNEYNASDIFNMVLSKKPTRIVVIRSQLSFKQGFYPRLKKYLDDYYRIEYSQNNTPGAFIIFKRN